MDDSRTNDNVIDRDELDIYEVYIYLADDRMIATIKLGTS